MDVEDLFDRVLIKFFLLSDTARQVIGSEDLSGPCIIVGMRAKEVTPEVLSTFKFYTKADIQSNGFSYKVGEVPVHVKFIRNRYKFLENLDFKTYAYGEFYFPNPFRDYWYIRYFIR